MQKYFISLNTRKILLLQKTVNQAPYTPINNGFSSVKIYL